MKCLWRQQNQEKLGYLDTNLCPFRGKRKKAGSSIINSREWSCFLAEQERMGCSICPQPSAMPCPAFLLLVVYLFPNPPSGINVVGLMVMLLGADGALAKWHVAGLGMRIAVFYGEKDKGWRMGSSAQASSLPLPKSFCSRAVGEGRV